MTHDAEREEAYAHSGTGRLPGPRVMNIQSLAIHAVSNGENAVEALVI